MPTIREQEEHERREEWLLWEVRQLARRVAQEINYTRPDEAIIEDAITAQKFLTEMGPQMPTPEHERNILAIKSKYAATLSLKDLCKFLSHEWWHLN